MKKFKIPKIFNTIPVYAHCDIPCGIYDPIVAKIAAQTVLKMDVKIEAVEVPLQTTDDSGNESTIYFASSRYIAVKEEHAQIVKNELNILWADYFKPEHLEKYPELHDLFWNANKLAGANKQSVNTSSAKKLVETVDQIAKIFWATKGVDYNDPVSDIRYGS
ncbi:MAG: superoxide dismutase, Ni [Dehalococcoidia bacterium]|jgi:nickel superoxide dismutase|nr:superoxide dismutase, Ni [Chloroflexota bacterium]MCH2304896.1 superoxide dismutase, Ni [SAR202 cluster bacterium]|tara:strand:- start:182 stop:667 length:486 start_codon:yes stop_codon:yes gene_type:complete